MSLVIGDVVRVAGAEPTFNHTRGDSPRTPCEQCAEMIADRRDTRIAFLERKRLVTIEDCKVKLEAEDWHGIQDCGSDLRDIDNELDGLRY